MRSAALRSGLTGVVVLPGTGQFGAGANFLILGMGTLSLSSQQLVYVDGIRVNNATGSGIAFHRLASASFCGEWKW